MKKNIPIIVLILLIVLYFISSILVNSKKLLVYSNNVYLIDSKNVKKYNFKKLNNKDLNILYKNGEISKVTFKVINSGNKKFSLYDSKKNDISGLDYYYAINKNINSVTFKERDIISKSDMDNINRLLEDKNYVTENYSLNYKKTIELNDGQKLFFIGNFNAEGYYSLMELPDDIFCFEYIILLDKSGNYTLLHEIEVSGSDILDTKFLYFDCIMNLFDDNSYQIGTKGIIYSFHDSVPGELYSITNGKLKLLDKEGN